MKVWAASFNPSAHVKYGWSVETRSFVVRPKRTASVASPMISPAFGATTCAPSKRPVPASATSLMRPRSRLDTAALGSSFTGSEVTRGSRPATLASCSVIPMAATCGSVKVTRGVALRSIGTGASPEVSARAAWAAIPPLSAAT